MAFAQSEGKSQKKANFWPKKSRFFQSAITLSKIDKNSKFFFFWEKEVLNFQNPSDLLKSAENSRFGAMLKLGQICEKITKNSVFWP